MKLGVVGGGQLGRMMAEEASKLTELDLELFVLDPTPDCPASEFATQVIGDFSEQGAVVNFGKDMDVITFEIESANAEALLELEEQGKIIQPSPKTLSIIKDKCAQKQFLVGAGVPAGAFAPVGSAEDIASFAGEYRYPVVLKSRFGAYDGRGNRTVESEADIEAAMAELGGELYVEAWVPFVKELAIVAGRGRDGEIKAYRVVETKHTDHICDEVIAPAQVPAEVAAKAEAFAAKILNAFAGAGVFGIEMFLTEDGEVLLNEVAPRVHNSGHLTLFGSTISQFELHLRAVCGAPLGDPEPTAPVAVMKNILGARLGPADPQGIADAEALGAHVVIYGKKETKPKRKMGHLTVVGETVDETLQKAREAHRLINI